MKARELHKALEPKEPGRVKAAPPPEAIGEEEPERPLQYRVDGYVQCVHPEHGEAVVYQPGELLPEWAAEAFQRQQPVPEQDGQFMVYRLR